MQQTTIKTFGNLTKDAQTRIGKNKRSYAAFTVATNPEEGHTQYLKCFAWGRQLEFAQKLTKGVRIQITGNLTERAANNGDKILFVRAQFIRSFPRREAARA